MYHHQPDHPQTLDEIITEYSETLMGVDESIGRALDYLENNRLAENMLVVYMRVPMLAWAPGYIEPGTTIEENVLNTNNATNVMFRKWLTAQTGRFYRLPTEAEWEYACRAGSSSAYYYGDDASKLDEFGRHQGNSEEKYHKVAEKKTDQWGLHDMMGNVAEWTMDQYYEDYFDKLGSGVAENPWFKPEELYPRSIRGGSWSHEAEELRCAERQGSDPEWKRRDPQLPKSRWWHTSKPFFGFRLVSPREQPSKEEMDQYWLEAIEDY